MKKPLILIATCLPALVAQINPTASIAWQNNYPNSPVSPWSDPLLKLQVPAGAAVSGWSLPTTTSPFRPRIVSYPETDGLGLATGWDFLVNEKKFASCVTFVPISDDKYQNAEIRLTEILDSETLDYSVNAQFSGSIGGSIEGIEAKAQATTTIDASHHMASSDRLFVVSASITSGVIYTAGSEQVPKKGPISVQLTPAMADLAATKTDKFYETCGHGFVSSIGFGADLYIMMHFHDLTTQDRIDLDFDSKASAGLEDVFSAAASSKVRAKIDDLIVKNRLDISFVQHGGKIAIIPTDLNEAMQKVRGLAAEQATGPRPMYITVTPYTDLFNWPGSYSLDNSDLRQRSIRYYKRLSSLYFEILNIRNDYFHDRYDPTAKPANEIAPGDKYYYSYHHNLRIEDFRSTADLVKDQMDKVAALILLLDKPECNPKAISAIPASEGSAGELKLAAAQHRFKVDRFVADLTKNRPNDKGCLEAVKDALNSIGPFDDYRFMLTLPVPRNVFAGNSISEIEDTARNVDDRRFILGQYVFRHWIERPNQIRCRIYFECLSKADLDGYSKKIAAIPSPASNNALSLGAHCGTGATEQIVHVKAGYDVVISDARRDTTPTAYTLWTQDVPNGARELQPPPMVPVDAPTKRAPIKSRGTSFDIIVQAYEGLGLGGGVVSDYGTCLSIGDEAQFRFMDRGEAAPRYNTEISLKAVIPAEFP
jgi:hypothetical protein